MGEDLNEEFLEQLEKEKLSKKEEVVSKTKVDEDGTVFEWIEEKKAWFPKVDENFLVSYQASYGSENAAKRIHRAKNGVDYLWDGTHWVSDNGEHLPSDYYPETFFDGNGVEFKWDYDQKSWVNASNPSQKLNMQTSYVDPTTGVLHIIHNNEWIPETYTDPATGTVYKWNSVKEAYLPPGGFEEEGEDGASGKKKKKKEPTWFEVDENSNCHVYVSGLPLDMNQEEFHELMSKYGIVCEDEDTKKPKIKMYFDDSGQFKGDARCTYLKVESVDLALQLLDGLDVKGSTVHVERAQFSLKGEYNPRLRKKTKKKKKKKKNPQEKLLDWKPEPFENSRFKHELVTVIKNLFDPKDFEVDASKIFDIKAQVKEACEMFGEVKKITVYDRHPEGVITATFKNWDSADQCIETMNGTFLRSRQISVTQWDGTTSYQINETDAEREKRLQNWEKFIDEGNNSRQ